jgi:acetyl esterase/lipase
MAQKHKSSLFQSNKKSLSHVPKAPRLTTTLQKVSHSLPLIGHVFIAFLSFSLTISFAILAHVFDGGLRESWSLATTIVHASMKQALELHAPQGAHSMRIVRFLTSFKLPNFFFRKTRFTRETLTIKGSGRLCAQVRQALNINLEELTYTPEVSDERTLQGEWIESLHDPIAEENPDSPVILYLHGGAHIFMSPNSHRFITSEAARNCKAKVFALDYRLAPEAPFPSAVEDALAAYLALVSPHAIPKLQSNFADTSIPVLSSHRVFIMGDSSGSSLILQLLQVLKALALPMPAGVVMISPFLDHELRGKSWHDNWNSGKLQDF